MEVVDETTTIFSTLSALTRVRLGNKSQLLAQIEAIFQNMHRASFRITYSGLPVVIAGKVNLISHPFTQTSASDDFRSELRHEGLPSI
jgi:hypothetical protein